MHVPAYINTNYSNTPERTAWTLDSVSTTFSSRLFLLVFHAHIIILQTLQFTHRI
jgi:hypothetical protein